MEQFKRTLSGISLKAFFFNAPFTKALLQSLLWSGPYGLQRTVPQNVHLPQLPSTAPGLSPLDPQEEDAGFWNRPLLIRSRIVKHEKQKLPRFRTIILLFHKFSPFTVRLPLKQIFPFQAKNRLYEKVVAVDNRNFCIGAVRVMIEEGAAGGNGVLPRIPVGKLLITSP